MNNHNINNNINNIYYINNFTEIMHLLHLKEFVYIILGRPYGTSFYEIFEKSIIHKISNK
jgi:hypothetical protein